jgi:hypothetical protein
VLLSLFFSFIMSYDNTIQEVRIQQTFSEAATSWILQVVGVCSAIVFGVYSILSYRDAEIARQQAETANLFSLLALCSQVGSVSLQRLQRLMNSVHC